MLSQSFTDEQLQIRTLRPLANKSLSLKSVFIIGLAFLGAIGAFGVSWLAVVYLDYRKIEQRGNMMELITAEVFQISSLTSEYLLHPEPRVEQQWRTKHKAITKILDMAKIYDTNEDTSLYHMRHAFHRSQDLFKRIIELSDRSRDKEEISQLRKFQHGMIASELLLVTQTMTSQANLVAMQTRLTHEKATRRTAWMTGVFVLLLTAVLMALWWVLALRVIRPIRNLRDGIVVFGDDLNNQVKQERDDEIGNVAASFNKMAGRLRETLVSKEELVKEVKDRKIAEDKIKKSLAEKEILLKEIHHRVKNNLQVVTTLLSLQAGKVSNNESKEALEESQRRIRVMARIHETLHKSDDLTSINLRDFLTTVVNDTKSSINLNEQGITFHLNTDNVFLDIDHAIACGQIISELVSNSLKHGFSNGQDGSIEISMHLDENDMMELTVADDGKGLPDGFDIKQEETLGMRLVEALAMQLNAKVNIDGSNGTAVRITFKEDLS